MNKSELIEAVATRTEETKKVAETIFDATFEEITKLLSAGDKFTVPGFGTFQVKDRAERAGRNPQTGKAITIAAAKVPKFTAGKALKEAIQ